MRLAGGGNLAQCCGNHGIPLGNESHSALADVRATAQLLASLLPEHPDTIRELNALEPIQWPTVAHSGKPPLTRSESQCMLLEPPGYLQRLLFRMSESDFPIASEGATMAYTALLERVLEDRRVDDTEGDALVEMATNWGLSVDQTRLAHRDFLNKLAIAALADGVVTESERCELKLVARLLGHEQSNLDDVLNQASQLLKSVTSIRSPPKCRDSGLSGLSICFTGELQCLKRGQIISREYAHELAIAAGLVVMDSVTKKLDILVVADPHTQSGKAKKARQYGIRIMHELVLWNTLGIEVD